MTVGGRNISEICDMAIVDSSAFLGSLELSERDRMIAERVTKEINARLGFLLDVGLDYLTLSRSAGTLAGGEAQRIRLASQIGSGLVGTLYVLDLLSENLTITGTLPLLYGTLIVSIVNTLLEFFGSGIYTKKEA